MKRLSLIRVETSRVPHQGSGRIAPKLLEEIAAGLARIFHISCSLEEEILAADFAYDAVREQYYSTALLQRMAAQDSDEGRHLVGVCAADLFVPVLTFVFGEAQLAGRCAVVSLHRLREEFYGLPSRPELERERLLKVATHELGHTLGLRHCTDWRCVMASAHSVERVDLKTAEFCPRCRSALGADAAQAHSGKRGAP